MERLANHLFDWSLRLLGVGIALLIASVPLTAAGIPLGRLATAAGCSAVVLAAALYAVLAVAFVVGLFWALITE